MTQFKFPGRLREFDLFYGQKFGQSFTSKYYSLKTFIEIGSEASGDCKTNPI